MARVLVFFFLFYFFNSGLPQGIGSGTNGNLRLCIVEGRGSYKRAPRYCPVLDKENSGVECVIGTDRLDCLRRISKGTVDFGVFSPEDLVAAQWADIDVLVTNEIKLRNWKFERNIVAVVNRRILPDSSSTLHAVLRDSTLCHPGVGAEDIRPLSDTLAGYLETLVLERSCDPKLSLWENRLKSLADFFGKACKAGPWVPDKARDAELKRRYPSLCAACRSPACAASDRYWGDVGALTCLGEGAGDVTWAEYSDVVAYFGLNKTQGSTDPYPSLDRFALLCRDGSWQPLGAGEPCVWLNRPWNVIVAKRKASSAVSALAQSLTNATVTVGGGWRGALARLLESPAALRQPLRPPPPPQDYLARARGFREAYSQTGCDPPRYIVFCTTSLLEKNKCEWLSEAGAVYGIAPPLQCVVRNNTGECMEGIREGSADVTAAGSDWIVKGKRDYKVIPLLHEVTPIIEKTNTIVAYVKKSSKISSFNELRGKRAAFSVYDGAGWHAVRSYITEREGMSCGQFVGYFEEICAPGSKGMYSNVKDCYGEGEVSALKSLLEGTSDVAFVSMNTYNILINNPSQYDASPAQLQQLAALCPDRHKYCLVSWSSLGHLFTAHNVSETKRHEIVNVFETYDKMFGSRPPFHRPTFSLFGPFGLAPDVLFHNNTRSLATDAIFDNNSYQIALNFEKKFVNMTDFACGFGLCVKSEVLFVVLAVIFVLRV